MEPLRVSETHAGGDESAGAVCGLPYELFWIALSGGAVTLLLVVIFFATGHATLSFIALAAGPAVLSVGFAIFRQTHPPGYDTDLFDLWRHGPGFGPEPPREKLP